MWKPIKNYEGYYEINTDGVIRSLDRFVNNNGTQVEIKGVIRKPYIQGCGYLQIELCKNNKRSKLYIHRLVAKHFVKNPNNFSEVNHIDGNKNNNNYLNLEWVSRKQNYDHAIKNGLQERDLLGKFIKKK